MNDGPVIPSRSFNLATFNAQRLWLRDQSAQDGFHMLVRVLETEIVDVVCVQEVFACDFPRLPVNQPYLYDGPANSRGLVDSAVASVCRCSVRLQFLCSPCRDW